MPFSFSHDSASSVIYLNSVTQRGKLEVFSSSYLIDTTVPVTNVAYDNEVEGFSLTDNMAKMSSRNLSAFVNIGTEKKQYGALSTVEYNGLFEIEAELFVKSESLLNKIRQFVPFYMFLLFPLLFLVVLPLVQWMFSSRLYYAKCDKGKVRVEWFFCVFHCLINVRID